MKEYITPKTITKNDLKRVRKKLNITQAQLAQLINVSLKTIERWETSDKEINGPITTLLQLLMNDPNLVKRLEVPEREYPLRMRYMFRQQLCTIIDVDERNRRIQIYNFQTELIYRAFGKEEHPSYEEYEEFLKSRCIPENRDKMKLALKELGVPFYEPMLIIEKTEGRMAEDEFWIKIERD